MRGLGQGGTEKKNETGEDKVWMGDVGKCREQ